MGNVDESKYLFPWNGSEMVIDAYNKKNYSIDVTNSKSKDAIVFISSNALYYPNSEDSFVKFVEEDRYEWKNISKHALIRKKFF